MHTVQLPINWRELDPDISKLGVVRFLHFYRDLQGIRGR